MSILETPRVYFRGNVSWDPITTNNYSDFYDERCATPTLDTRDPANDFRNAAVAAIVPKGNWNPHGTHRARFYDCAISGVDIGGGLNTRDAFVNANAAFTAMLVDLEPYGAYTSQLFFDEMSFGIDGGCQIRGKRVWRFTGRQINFSRNPTGIIAGVASVVFQTSFPKDRGLEIHAHDSETLARLDKAMADADVLGLTVRWTAYHTVYYDDPGILSTDPNWQRKLAAWGHALVAKINAGGFQPNPARSELVGTIGLWRRGEPALEPGDRALLAAQDSDTSPTYVATARARTTDTTLTIDLSNSISEADASLTKQDLGPLEIVAINKRNELTTLGNLAYGQYARPAYLDTSGLVTLQLDKKKADAAKDGTLAIQQPLSPAPNVLLQETRYYAVPAAPNLYIDADVRAEARFQILDRGSPTAFDGPVDVYQMNNGGGKIVAKFTLKAGKNGAFTLPIEGKQGDIFAYVPVLPGQHAPTDRLDVQLNTYMYVRVLPDDAGVAELEPTWENVYNRVLINWKAMAPCMDNWLDLADPKQVRAYAPVLKRLTDPANFESFLYMPVVRDLTKGERILLWKFLDAPPQPLLAVAASTTSDGQSELSRSMRAPKLT
jgi:hypothetical protein